MAVKKILIEPNKILRQVSPPGKEVPIVGQTRLGDRVETVSAAPYPPPPSNEQQATSNTQQASGNNQQATISKQQATRNNQRS